MSNVRQLTKPGSSPMLISIWRKRVPIERSILAYSPLTAPHSVPDLAIRPNQKVEDIVPLVEAWNANVSATNAGAVLSRLHGNRVSASDSRLRPVGGSSRS